MTAQDNPRYVNLDDVLKTVKVLHDRKIASATKALQNSRGNVAQHRFEEARVLMEEVIPALKELARVHDFAHNVGMDVLQRIADGADEVNVRLIGPFLDTDLRVQSVHPTDSGEASVTLDEALDMVEELVGQALYTDDGVNFDHSCLSTYEDACEFLARVRPERWKLTSRGVREVPVDD